MPMLLQFPCQHDKNEKNDLDQTLTKFHVAARHCHSLRHTATVAAWQCGSPVTSVETEIFQLAVQRTFTQAQVGG